MKKNIILKVLRAVFILLLLNMACSIDTDASQSEPGSDAHLLSWISKYNLQLDTDIYNSLPAVQHKGQLTETVVFIHAVFGTFTYKRKTFATFCIDFCS